jgi:hypothetical protein
VFVAGDHDHPTQPARRRVSSPARDIVRPSVRPSVMRRSGMPLLAPRSLIWLLFMSSSPFFIFQRRTTVHVCTWTQSGRYLSLYNFGFHPSLISASCASLSSVGRTSASMRSLALKILLCR